MKTAAWARSTRETSSSNPKLLELATHYGVLPKACRPYRAKTKGKVERPSRYCIVSNARCPRWTLARIALRLWRSRRTAWGLVVLGEVAVDGGLKVDQRAEHAAPQAAVGQLAKKLSTALSQEAEVGV